MGEFVFGPEPAWDGSSWRPQVVVETHALGCSEVATGIMPIGRWVTSRGVDWILLDRPNPDPTPELVHARISVDFGYSSVAVDKVGLAPLVAIALSLELGRPIDSDPGRPDMCAVSTSLGLDLLTFELSGSEPTVATALRRLDEILREPTTATLGHDFPELVERSRQVGHPLPGGALVLLHQLGSGAAALSAAIDGWKRLGDQLTPEDLHAALRDIDPAVGHHRWAGWADAGDLLAAAPGTPSPLPAPGHKRSGRSTPASLDGAPAHYLLSFTRPPGPAATIALHLLVRLLQVRLVQFDRLAGSLQTGLYLAEGRELVLIEAEQMPDPVAAARAVAEVLHDLPGTDPGVIQNEINRMVEEAAEERQSWDGNLFVVRHLIDGGRPTPQLRLDGFLAVTVADVQGAWAQMTAGVLLGVPTAEAAPAGYPLVNPADVPVKGTSYGSWVPVRGKNLPQRTVVRTDGNRLTTLLQTGQSAAFGWRSTLSPQTTVDLHEPVLRIDLGAYSSTLMDAKLATAVLEWPTIRRGARLKSMVDACTAATPTIRLPPLDPAYEQAVRQAGRAGRRQFGIFYAVAVVFLLALVALVLSFQSSSDRPTVATLGAGQTATLTNGSTITVSQVRAVGSASAGGLAGLTATVRFCAGGPTHQRGFPDDGRDYIGPEKFQLVSGPSAVPARAGMGLGSQVPLAGILLDKGQCTEGQLNFLGGTPGAGSIRYSNLGGDDIRWTV